VKLNMDATLRADTTSRWNAYSVALRDGWMTKDEVRALEDLPPLDAPDPVPATPAPDAVEAELPATTPAPVPVALVPTPEVVAP
jgi:hypothetical protein